MSEPVAARLEWGHLYVDLVGRLATADERGLDTNALAEDLTATFARYLGLAEQAVAAEPAP